MRTVYVLTSVIVCMAILLATGCQLLFPSKPFIIRADGSAIVQYGDYLYLLGGMDEDSRYLKQVLIAVIQDPEDLSSLKWEAGTALPDQLAFFSAFAAGRRLYIIGGENDAGPQRSIYYTYINDDGSLASPWRVNPVSLPYPLSRMGFALHDGRIFLAGGCTDSGLSDSVIHARISPSVHIGHWYESTERLPTPRYHTSAQVMYAPEARLTVAGGIDASDEVLDDLISYAIGTYGKLEAPVSHGDMPEKLYDPILSPDPGSITVLGGYSSSGEPPAGTYRFDFSASSWTAHGSAFYASGPWNVRSRGKLWAPAAGSDTLSFISHAELFAPSVPTLFPGSGLVGDKVRPVVISEPGSTVYFSIDGSTWNTSVPSISGDTALLVQSKRDGTYSPEVTHTYSTQTLGLAIFISGTISLQASSEPEFQFLQMGSSTSDQWKRIILTSREDLMMYWKDSRTCPAYSAAAALTLYEFDLHTEVLDRFGDPVRGRSSDTDSPIQLTLNPGTFYLHIQADAQTTLGLSLNRVQ